MNKYIDTDILKVKITDLCTNANFYQQKAMAESNREDFVSSGGEIFAYAKVLSLIDSLQQEQPSNIIQWTGNNLKEVIDFVGKSPRFEEWFKSWDEFESYVHSHGDILKLFSGDGSHYEVPVGAWIVKTPDGHNVPSVVRFIHAKRGPLEVDLEKFLSVEFV